MRLILSNQPREIDLGLGVKVEVRPGATAVIVAAGEDVARSGDVGRVAFVKAVARAAIIGWSGVMDDEDQPVEPSPEGIDALMDVYPIFAAFERFYVNPAFAVVTEGNA